MRAVAKLTKRSARKETRLYLLEGPQAAREALAFQPGTVVELFATPAALEKHTDIPTEFHGAVLGLWSLLHSCFDPGYSS